MILIMGAVGYKNRLFQTLMIFLRLAFAFIVAYACRGAFGDVLAKIVPTWGIAFWSFAAFVLLFAAFFLLLTYATLVYVEGDAITVPSIIDRIGGVVAGAASGAMIVGILLVAWSLAVSFSPLRFVTEESDLKIDMGRVVLHEFGRLNDRIPGNQPFSTTQAIDIYRNADTLAVQKAKAATPPPEKKEEPPKKGKGTAAEIEDDASNTTLKKQLLKDQE
ncbi:MAG: hypothetical protein AB1696_06600 [Planctomycetota bacterium]